MLLRDSANRWRFSAGALCVLMLSIGYATAQEQETRWDISFDSFFGKGRKGDRPLVAYARERGGEWVAAVGSSRKRWNTAYYLVGLDALARKGDTFSGDMVVSLTPDPWVPSDHKAIRCVLSVDFTRTAEGLSGEYALKSVDSDSRHAQAFAKKGKISGSGKPYVSHELPGDVTLNLTAHSAMVGGKPDYLQRRIEIRVYFKDGKSVAGEAAQVGLQNKPYGWTPFAVEPGSVKADKDGVSGRMSIPFLTLDNAAATYDLTIKGGLVEGLLAGTYDGEVRLADGTRETLKGGFDGKARPGLDETRLTPDKRPWYVRVEDWKPVAPGEHPRLFFRKSDLPELRRRAETEAGKQIIARLKVLLGGGEAMPTSFNPSREVREGSRVAGYKPVDGTYSISHAAGFGFLYQITGDKKYAALARKCMELAFEGQRDMDNRYSWKGPYGELRGGPSLAWGAAAYDLCYDAWDEKFRKDVALRIQNYRNEPFLKGEKNGKKIFGRGVSLEQMVWAPNQGPGSNHYGPVVGGCGLAVLAIKGDPGTDDELLERYHRRLLRCVEYNLADGFGDGGFFEEGHGPGQICSDTAFIPYLQALRTAAGIDFRSPRRNARFMTMRLVYELLGAPVVYPYRSRMADSYGTKAFYRLRGGLSRGGQFCQGFGMVSETDAAALLWTYNTLVEPDPAARTYDTVSRYPHRPMLALINWPLDVEPRNPAEVLPLHHCDTTYGYYVFRNRWKDKDDIVVSALLKGPFATPNQVMAWGLGEEKKLGGVTGALREYRRAKDGSAILAAGSGALAADFSGASDADALVVVTSLRAPKKKGKKKPGKKRPSKKAAEAQAEKVHIEHVWVAGLHVQVCTFSAAGKHPAVLVENDVVKVGGQDITCRNGTLLLKVFLDASPVSE